MSIIMNKTATRRNFIKSSIFGVGLLNISSCLATSNKTQKPNVIYILADDLGYGELSCYGQKKFKSPNLDKMAKEGMKFTDHYAGATVCAPSRCSLLTGKDTGHCFIRGNREMKPEGQLPLPVGTVTIASIMKQAGYKTAAIGKWGLGGPNSSGHPNQVGFDYFFGHLCQRRAHKCYPPYLWRNNKKVRFPGNIHNKHTTYAHDLFATEAMKFIADNKDKPFFLYLPFTIPHAEMLVPNDDLSKFNTKWEEKPYHGRHYGSQKTPRAALASMITRMDRDIGKIFSLLKKFNLDENTLVIFSSDNGPHLEGGNDPVFFDSNGPLRGFKRDLYEGGIREPMIARWPGKIKAGTTTAHISAFCDILPTFAELVNVPAPKDIQGISFLPTLLDEGKQQQHKYLYWEFSPRRGAQALRVGDWKAIRIGLKKDAKAPIQLYNLKTDIGETTNVAKKYPKIVKQMKELFKEARVKSKEFRFRALDKNI